MFKQDKVFEAYLSISAGTLTIADENGKLWALKEGGVLERAEGSVSIGSLGSPCRLRLDFGEMKWQAIAIKRVSLQSVSSDSENIVLTYDKLGRWKASDFYYASSYTDYIFRVETDSPSELYAWVPGPDGNLVGVGESAASAAVSFTMDESVSRDKVCPSIDMNNGRSQSFDTQPREINAIFVGDSITNLWTKTDASFFTDNGYIGRGVDGLISSLVKSRFQNDVIADMPYVAHIMCGTNDVAENGGSYVESSEVVANIAEMAELAFNNGIYPVIGSVLPCKYFYWRGESWSPSKPGVTVPSHIIEINNLLKSYCAEKGFTFVDYYSILVNTEDYSFPLSIDGCHPALAAYLKMEARAKTAITSNLPANQR